MRDPMGDAMNGMSKWAVAASVAAVLGVQAMGQQAATVQTTGGQTAPVAKRVIVVSLEDRKLALVEDGQVKKVYTVAVGKPIDTEPDGHVHDRAAREESDLFAQWQDGAAGAGESGGDAVDGAEQQGYGIHGTNEPKSIGKAASHGCIRMAKADLEEMYELVRWATRWS